jgi:hypothetical protein
MGTSPLQFVVTEAANLRRPGQYRLIFTYPDLQASGEFRFTVATYDLAALRARASELYRSVVLANPNDPKGNLYEVAVTGMDPSVSKPFLCAILKLNRPAQPTVLRLEEIGDNDSVGCLIDAFPASQGLHRQVIEGALRRLIKRAPDGALKTRMSGALEVQ